MSSLERVELLSTLEEQYQTELDEDAFSRLKSTPQLDEWLRHSATTGERLERSPELSDWARSLPLRAIRTSFQQILAVPLFPNPVASESHRPRKYSEPGTACNFYRESYKPSRHTGDSHRTPHRWRMRLVPAMSKDHSRPHFEPEQFPRWKVLFSTLTYVLACQPLQHRSHSSTKFGRKAALRYTGELINRGFCPLVFPEGSRTRDGAILPFRPGVGMMAVRLRVRVVPIRIKGLYEIYSIHDSWPRLGPVEVSFGRPMIFLEGTRYEEVAERLEAEVRNL